jgi:MFS superfamily sulfate permease-like transporter
MKNTYSLAAAGALAVTAASFVVEVGPGQDVTYPLFMLGGPILTGAVLGRRWRLGAAAWSLAALLWLVLDWAINHEDVAFHAVIAVLFAGLVALGAGASRLGRRARA